MAFGRDRTVKVGLKLDVGNYVSQIGAAGKATQDFGKKAVDHAGKHKQSWQEVGTGMLAVGAAIGAGVGLAVKAYADFDKEMSKVRAVSGATAGEMNQLRDAAIDAGAKTAFSASEAAAATTELAKAGVSTADILGGALMGSLDLAAAGGLDLAFAAETAGQAMNLFKLKGKDVPRIADALANGANKSAADVSDLAQAMSQAGLVAAQTGLSLEDTVGVLSAFADRALRGSDAGTSLKTMLQRLNPQSKEAANLMDELNLRAYDAQGNFIGLEAYAQKLQDALSGMSVEQRNAAMQTLFGADAVRAANVLYDLGAQGVREYVDAIGTQGEAARVAAIQLDNLHGDIEELGGAFETVLIQGGGGANDALRDMVQTVTSLVRAYGDLPKPVQEGVVTIAALTAGVLLLGGAFLTLMPRVAATKAALIELTGSATAARTAVGMLAGVMGTVAAAMAAVELGKWSARASVATQDTKKLAASMAELDKNTQAGGGALGDLFESDAWGARDKIKSTADALDAFGTSAQVALGQNWGDRIDRFGDFGSSMERFTEQTNQLDASLAYMVENGNIDGAADMYDELMAAIERANKAGANIPVDEVRAKFTKYQGALDAAKGATQDVTKMQGGLNAALAAGGETAEKAREEIDELIDSLMKAGIVQLDARSAARQFKQAIADATAAVKENGRTLNTNTEAGRKNEAALDEVAQSAINQAQAIYGATNSEEKFRASLLESRDSLVATAKKFGMSQKDAEKYADSVLNIPAVKKVQFTTPGLGGAISDTRIFKTSLDKIGNKTVRIHTVYSTSGKRETAHNFRQEGFATGGFVSGAGTATSDSIPAWLSNGEYVVNAQATRTNRALLEAINSGRSVKAFAAGGYAGTTATTHQSGPLVVAFSRANMRQFASEIANVALEVDGEVLNRSAGRSVQAAAAGRGGL